jgi:ubiquinone biosynthesis protein
MVALLKNAHVISTFIELNTKLRIKKTPPKELGQWLAKRVQVLGPTYIKIGQFISSRSDIFGEDFSDQFVNLRDQVQPMAKHESKVILDKIAKKYSFISNIDEEPLASASIGQVHKAKDKNGNELLLKIKRSNIKQIVNQDLAFIRFLFDIASFASVNNMQPTMTIFNDFEAFLTQEISFQREVANLVRFYSLYMPIYGNTFLTVPRVVKNACDDDVIIMEYIHNHGCFDSYQGDRSELAKNIMRFFLRQLVQYGFMHGDPHKGNLGITSDNKLVMYDFGNVVDFTEEERNILKELIYMLVLNNKQGAVKLLKQLDVTVVDKEKLYDYIDRYVQYMRTLDINVFRGLQTLNSNLPVHFSGKIIRIIRVYGTLEGVCKELDPNFNYFQLLDDKIADLALDDDFLTYKVDKDFQLLGSLPNIIMKMFNDES